MTELNNLAADEIGRLFPIFVVPYNKDWAAIYENEKSLIIKHLCDFSDFTLEHIGSTAIPEISAKPVIDILLEIKKLTPKTKSRITEILCKIDYENMTAAETDKKMCFGKGYFQGANQRYHLHIREKSADFQDEIYFRDYLRRNANARQDYENLKLALAEKYRFNRENYTNAKTEFVKNILLKAKGTII